MASQSLATQTTNSNANNTTITTQTASTNTLTQISMPIVQNIWIVWDTKLTESGTRERAETTTSLGSKCKAFATPELADNYAFELARRNCCRLRHEFHRSGDLGKWMAAQGVHVFAKSLRTTRFRFEH